VAVAGSDPATVTGITAMKSHRKRRNHRRRARLRPMEQIFYGEFDGGRDKRVLVKIIGE
jgi:hypothetical protein